MTNETMEAMYEHAARHARSAYLVTKNAPAGQRESHRKTSLAWARGTWRSVAGDAVGYASAFSDAYDLARRGGLDPVRFASDRARGTASEPRSGIAIDGPEVNQGIDG